MAKEERQNEEMIEVNNGEGETYLVPANIPDLFSYVSEEELLPPDLVASDFVGEELALLSWVWKEHAEHGKFFVAECYVQSVDDIVNISFFSWMAIRQLEGVEKMNLKPPFKVRLEKDGKSYRLRPSKTQ